VSSLPRPTRPSAPFIFAAATAVLALALSGCTPKAEASGTQPSASASGSASESPSPTTPPAAPVKLVAASPQSPMKALTFALDGATLTSATVTNHAGGATLIGSVATTGRTWSSDDLAYPGATYDVNASYTDSNGQAQTAKASIRITSLSDTSTVGYTITPTGGTVGVNAPLVIRFFKSVTDRKAVERALAVYSTTPVVGAWHWMNSQEVHFRPQTTWPTHTQIRLVVALEGVRAGATLFGQISTTVNLTVGDAHFTKVDGKKHTLSVYVNGKLKATWPTSLGRPEFATRSGNYIVLLKQPTRRMTSCHANITCDPKNPNFYDLTVNWDSRLTWSGTFIHSAPWSVGSQGRANVSHGCINLSPSHAIAYYKLAQYGDLVTVTGTIRGPADLVASGDPGMTDWNTTWSAWLAGSALHASVTTGPIPAG
jgi:lipoprotein-anchoring transpeptidase ErfK/SrfK